MKTHVVSPRSWPLLLALTALAAPCAATDQGPNSTVTIHAGDPQAAEAFSNPGTFTIRHIGGTNFSQLIFYELSGTASNGVDYQQLGGTVQMPAGALAVSFNVIPIDDSLIEGTETLVARIMPSPLQCPTCGYDIGQPDVAELSIYDNDISGTNHPPFIRLNSPPDAAVFTAPAQIELHAYAQDPEDRFFVSVEFFEGTNSLGLGTFEASTCPAPYCPYFAVTWSNVPPGKYTLTARVTDSLGLSSTSDPARVTVLDPGRPRGGLYQITSGRFRACCGFGGFLGYDLPAEFQSFVSLEVDQQNNTATMAFLGDDAQTVFRVLSCPPGNPIPFRFDHGLVFSNWIAFHVDPGPESYWNYTVSNSFDTLRIDGMLGLTRRGCVDLPNTFTHSNVVAILVPQPPRIDGLERQGAAVRFRFIGEPPYDYFVEYSQSLHAQNWLSLTNFRAKAGTIQALVTDPVTNSTTRFYRIRRQPCLCRTTARFIKPASQGVWRGSQLADRNVRRYKASDGSNTVAGNGICNLLSQKSFKHNGKQTLLCEGGDLHGSQAIAVSADDIYITCVASSDGNFGIGRVVRVDLRTGTQTIVSEGSYLVGPVGIAIDDDGQIIVCDPYTINPESIDHL